MDLAVFDAAWKSGLQQAHTVTPVAKQLIPPAKQNHQNSEATQRQQLNAAKKHCDAGKQLLLTCSQSDSLLLIVLL